MDEESPADLLENTQNPANTRMEIRAEPKKMSLRRRDDFSRIIFCCSVKLS